MSDYPAPRPEGYPSEAQVIITDPDLGATSTTDTDSGSAAASTAETAKEAARSVTEDAKDQSQQVAAHAAEQTKQVVGEAKSQVGDLLWQSRSELSQQASAQQQRLAHGLRSLADELDEMTGSSQQHGLAAEAAAMVSGRIAEAADFLEKRDFNGAIDELSGFARRRPGAFLLGAALIGIIAGRVTRGLASDSGQPESATGEGEVRRL